MSEPRENPTEITVRAPWGEPDNSDTQVSSFAGVSAADLTVIHYVLTNAPEILVRRTLDRVRLEVESRHPETIRLAREASVDPHRGMIERTAVPQESAAALIRAQASWATDDEIAIAAATVEAMGRYFDEYDAQRVAAQLRDRRPAGDL